MNKPLLSICIPTYNRATYLEKCLEAIVAQDGFNDQMEVVISDNCSTDNTQNVGMHYQNNYNNIHYFRNSENIADANFPLALERAVGIFRKLTNDTVLYLPGAIQYMLDAIRENIQAEKRPQLYFLNGSKPQSEKKRICTLEAYIDAVSFYITWIGSFAIWEEDCVELELMTEKSSTKLAQVPFRIANFKKHGGAVVYDKVIMSSMELEKKDLTYGLYQVFYVTFLSFFREHLDSGEISKECYERLRKDLLLVFFCEWIVKWKLDREKYVFSDEDLKGLIEKAYRKDTYFLEYRFRLIKRCLKRQTENLWERIRLGAQ